MLGMNHLEMEITFVWYGGRDGVQNWEAERLGNTSRNTDALWCLDMTSWFILSILIHIYISSYLHFEKRVSQLNGNGKMETMIQVWAFPTASLLAFYSFPLK